VFALLVGLTQALVAMKTLAVTCLVLSVLLTGFIAANAKFAVNSARVASAGADASLVLEEIRTMEDVELLRYSAETYAMSHSTATWHLARYVAYFYVVLVALVFALIALGLVAHRASNNSFKGMPLRGTP